MTTIAPLRHLAFQARRLAQMLARMFKATARTMATRLTVAVNTTATRILTDDPDEFTRRCFYVAPFGA
jgi:hypothetical protein